MNNMSQTKFTIFAIYVVGFVIFTFLMNYFKIDDFLPFHSNNITKDQLKDSALPKTSFIEETVLKPDEKSQPLTLSKEQLGRHSWALLHSIAASFPLKPSNEDQKHFENLMISLSHLYPCKQCATHFQEMLTKNPFRHSSRDSLVYYICDLHNQVNKRIGKPHHSCSNAFKIWGGNCDCDKPSFLNKN